MCATLFFSLRLAPISVSRCLQATRYNTEPSCATPSHSFESLECISVALGNELWRYQTPAIEASSTNHTTNCCESSSCTRSQLTPVQIQIFFRGPYNVCITCRRRPARRMLCRRRDGQVLSGSCKVRAQFPRIQSASSSVGPQDSSIA